MRGLWRGFLGIFVVFYRDFQWITSISRDLLRFMWIYADLCKFTGFYQRSETNRRKTSVDRKTWIKLSCFDLQSLSLVLLSVFYKASSNWHQFKFIQPLISAPESIPGMSVSRFVYTPSHYEWKGGLLPKQWPAFHVVFHVFPTS